MAIQLTKWEEIKIAQHENFNGNLLNRLNDLIKNGERTIFLMNNDKKEILEVFNF